MLPRHPIPGEMPRHTKRVINKAYKAGQIAEAGPGEWTRRGFMGLGVKVVAGIALAEAGAKVWTQESYSSNGTTLEMVGGKEIESKLLIVSFGGEGNDQDYFGALSAFKASGKRIPSADMRYDDVKGLDFKAVGKVLKEAQQKRGFEKLILDCHSLGGMIGLLAALEAGIPVAGIVLNCSPEELGNATGGAVLAADFVAAAPKDTLTQTIELWGKDFGCYWRDSDSIGSAILGLPREFWTLPSQMTQGASAHLQDSELEAAKYEINSGRLLQTMHRQGLIQKNLTSPVFVMSPNDGVVKDMAAYRGWSEDFAHIGISHIPLLQMSSDSVHADVFHEGAPLQQIHYYDDLIRRFDTNPPILL